MSYFPASFHSRQLTHPEWPWKKGGCAVRIITQSITDYSQADGMIFILEQVHIISIYFSVLVHVIPKWRLVPTQVTPARMSSFRFSIWMKFSLWYVSFWYHVNRKWTLFQIENHQSCSLGLAVNMHLRGVYMRKIALAWVSHQDDFLILYRVYMMTGSIHILLFKGTFRVDKIHMWFKNRKHYVCTTRSSLSADRFHTETGGRFVFTWYRCEISYWSEILARYENRGELARGGSRRGDSHRHNILWWYHANKYRAMRGNWSELASGRKLPRCHVNTPWPGAKTTWVRMP